MKFLVTNDDGIDAPGLAALVAAAEPLGECVVVAPAEAQSGVSHRVTWQEGVRIEPRKENRYAIHGTPDVGRIPGPPDEVGPAGQDPVGH